MSQPRVQAAGGTSTSYSNYRPSSSSQQATSSSNGNFQNQKTVQHQRYDSIEHQRQSQINKFMQSPQEQIANIMKNKQSDNSAMMSSKKVNIKPRPQGSTTVKQVFEHPVTSYNNVEDSKKEANLSHSFNTSALNSSMRMPGQEIKPQIIKKQQIAHSTKN